MTVINMKVKTITVIVIAALCLMPIGIAEERHTGYVTHHHNQTPINMITEERHTGYIDRPHHEINLSDVEDNHQTGYIIPPHSMANNTVVVTMNVDISQNKLTIEDMTLRPDTTTTVPIRLLNSTGVGGGTMTLTFNPAIANVTSVVVGDFNIFAPDYSNVDTGTLRLTYMKSGAGLTGDLTIATVTLEAVGASGSCELGLSAELINAGGNSIPVNVDNGIFNIYNRIPGDVTGDSKVNICDAVLLSNYVSFPNERETTYKLTIEDNANVNGDDKVNICDVVLLFNWVSFPNERGTTYILR